MITIITACFNSEKTISKAIESLLSQTCANFEHIVVDGLSTDNTLSIVESYKEQYLKKDVRLTIISEKDKGLYDALNKGIANSSGNIIGILNADDQYEHNTIEIVSRLLRSDDSIDVVMGASKTIGNGKNSFKKPKNAKFITSRGFNHGAMFVKKECYESIGTYITNGNYYADFEWYIRARKAKKKFYLTNDNLYDFSLGGMSTRKSIKEVRKRIKYRYEAYRLNKCSRLYWIECVVMELAKFVLA